MVFFKKIVEHLKGVAILGTGANWYPPETNYTKAKRTIRFLEDKRVLYNPYSLECIKECVDSVWEIREFLNKEMQDKDISDHLCNYLADMRSSCLKFLDRCCHIEDVPFYFLEIHKSPSNPILNHSLEKLRNEFGCILSKMTVDYKIEIMGELVSILPHKE